MKEPNVLLMGAIPLPPYILARDESAASMIRRELHYDWSRVPNVFVVEDWPEDWNVNAVVVTPISILGTDDRTSFSIIGDEGLTESERAVLDGYIKVKRATSGGKITYRQVSNTLGISRHKVMAAVKSLANKGIGTSREYDSFDLDIGTWVPDATKAKALGIKIKEW